MASNDRFVKFPKIPAFKSVCYHQMHEHGSAKVTYGAKIKLHGTNAGIRISVDGNVTAQKRTSDITVDADNAGFAAWVDSCKDKWRAAVRKNGCVSDMTVIVYGEWAGRGVQRGPEAICMLEKKHFFVFGVKARDSYITCPRLIALFVPVLEDVRILPWFFSPEKPEMSIDFDKTDTLKAFSELINDAVGTIEVEDPYMKETFQLSGPGEGLVLTPYRINEVGKDIKYEGEADISLSRMSDFTFKAKVEAHRSQRSKAPVMPISDIPESVREFVQEFVTEARCRQGLKEACGGIAEKVNIPTFSKWVGQDVKEESSLELQEMEFSWKLVSKAVHKAAIGWFLKECAKK